MEVAVIGAGINGVCIGWELALAGHPVQVFERDTAMAHTSSASSKLLHGGLRYLENAEFLLVREALIERRAWLEEAPELARLLKLTLPIYRDSRRGKIMVGFGLRLYDWRARGSGMSEHLWITREQMRCSHPMLKGDGLVGAFQFWDGLKDDRMLGLWAVSQALAAGAVLEEGVDVKKLAANGKVVFADGSDHRFDRIINAAGPWATKLIAASGLDSRYQLDLVRGSHIVLNRPVTTAYILEIPDEKRIFFVLPWQGRALVGTTEVRQTEPDKPQASSAEIDYLLSAYNAYFCERVSKSDIDESFAGVRPLVKSTQNPNKATSEYVIEKNDRLINVFGGKWTTARALARNVRKAVESK